MVDWLWWCGMMGLGSVPRLVFVRVCAVSNFSAGRGRGVEGEEEWRMDGWSCDFFRARARARARARGRGAGEGPGGAIGQAMPCHLGLGFLSFAGSLCLMRAGNTRPGPVLGAVPEQEAT